MTHIGKPGGPSSEDREFWQDLAEASVNHLSQKELADRWRISPRTLERWRAAKTGPPWLRLGARRIAYRLEDVLAYERACLEGD